jgi:hypothetical protein
MRKAREPKNVALSPFHALRPFTSGLRYLEDRCLIPGKDMNFSSTPLPDKFDGRRNILSNDTEGFL